MPRKLRKLPKQSIWIDDRGRTTIPSYLLEAAGIKKPGWAEIGTSPSLEECESLFIKRTLNDSSEKQKSSPPRENSNTRTQG